MIKYSEAVENYFQKTIKKSWTWDRLTEEERQRFIDMDVFDKIKGNEKQRIEWLNTIYTAYITALGYKPIGWREPEAENKMIIYGEWTDEISGCWHCSICLRPILLNSDEEYVFSKYCPHCGAKMGNHVE